MIFGAQHAGNDRYFGSRRHELSHQFARQTSVQPRFHTHDTRPPAFRRIGGNANHSIPFSSASSIRGVSPCGFPAVRTIPFNALVISSLKASVSASPKHEPAGIQTGPHAAPRCALHPALRSRVDRRKNGFPAGCKLQYEHWLWKRTERVPPDSAYRRSARNSQNSLARGFIDPRRAHARRDRPSRSKHQPVPQSGEFPAYFSSCPDALILSFSILVCLQIFRL